MKNKVQDKRKAACPSAGARGGKPKNRLVIIIAALVAAVLIFGVVMLVIGIVRDRDVAMEHEGVYVKRGEAAYLAAVFKSSFISTYRLVDTPEAWAREYSEGVSWGDVLEQKTEEYIRQITFGAYLFDSIATMAQENVELIEEQLLSMLDLQRVSRDYLDSQEGVNGFNYEDMKNASLLLYKNYLAKRLLFGDEGTSLEQGFYSEEGYYRDEVMDFFASEYRYVKIAYIRLNEEIVFDDSGNYNPLQTGVLETRELSEDERVERAELVRELELLLSSAELTEATVDGIIDEYNEKYNYSDSGYYFSSASEATVYYGEHTSSEVINKIFAMDEGECAIVKEQGMVCVIYRGALTSEAAFADIAYDDFFGDFYSDAATYIYGALLSEGMTQVGVKDAYYEIDIEALKPNTEYKLRWLFG